MEKGIKTEIKWDYLGSELATLSDEEQSKFFIGFIKKLGIKNQYRRSGINVIIIKLNSRTNHGCHGDLFWVIA